MWALRLGGFLFFTRILPGERDPRYDEVAKDHNPYIFFFMNYMMQGVLALLCTIPLYFCFLSTLTMSIQFYIGVGMIIIGTIFEAMAD